MKILIIYQHYWPEQFKATDIAESLAKLGHSVTVLCGLPNYPQGYIYEGYKRAYKRLEEHNGVNIIRVKEIARRNNILFRALNYWSYPHYAKRYIRKHHIEADVVLSIVTSPIMMASPAIYYKKIYNKPVIMYEMDLWPESLLAGGISNKSLIYKHYKKVSSSIYSKCDKILVSTKEHIDYIKALPNCNNLDISYLPQYAESIFEESSDSSTNNNTIDLMFAGNIGKAQSLKTLIEAANILKNDYRYKFHIVGDGSELNNIKKLANEYKLDNVIFYGQRPLLDMPNFYNLADIMVVSLEDKPYANITLPGKVQSYMAYGKPLLGIVNGSTASFILDNKIGYVSSPNDVDELVNTIKGLDTDKLREIGKYAKSVYLKEYRKELFINKLVDVLSIRKD